jgi:SAM-dependent methyltransferase
MKGLRTETSVPGDWLEDTRRFWNTDSDSEAKYRRICLDPEIEATTDEAELAALWHKRTEAELAQLLRGIPIQADWTCLEIGCGLGRLMKPIAQQCARVIGIDVSPRMVEFAGEYLGGVPNTEVHLNDGRTIPMVPDASIDWVYSHLAFQHLTLYEVVDRYLAEIHRVLKPGGYCRIQCWREAALPLAERAKNVARLLSGRERYHGPRRWLWGPGKEVKFGGVTFHPKAWRKLLASHGLRVTSLQPGMGHDHWMWTTSRKR